MGIAVTDEQMALAEAVGAFTSRLAPMEHARKLLDSGSRDGEDSVWQQFVRQGFATMHLPDASGEVATLADVAIMLEQAGRSLVPGPLLPTVLTSLLIGRHGTGTAQAELLDAFARGARGACDLSASQLTAVASGDGWLLTGTTGLILGAPGADYLLLRTLAGSEEVWLAVAGRDVVIREEAGVDGTRTLGRVECAAGQVVPASRINVTQGQVKAAAAALFAAEAVGIARWCQETGAAYAKIREQFGRPIAAFQAIKHKCARIFVTTELMAAAAWDAAMAWEQDPEQFELAAQGLVSPQYPPPYGLGVGPAEQVIIAEEFDRAGIAQPSTLIGEWALPTIIVHGNDAQRERFTMPSLRGEVTWCQLFSEPGAGSDLASLRLRAQRAAGGWVLNGQKVWSSNAHVAEWGICLARTDPEASKHRGISYFLIDMSSPGLTVRQLREADGSYMFNETFFDDVFVPDDCLVGQPNDGWRLARTTLGNERLSIGGGLGGGRRSPAQIAADAGATGPDVEFWIGALTSGYNTLGALSQRMIVRSLNGLEPAADGELAEYADLSAYCGGDLNDMVIDPAGRAYVGDFGPDLMSAAPTSLKRVDPDGRVTIAADGLRFPNGSAITPDGRTLIVGETMGNRLTAFDLAPDGSLSRRRVWAQLGPEVTSLDQLRIGPDGCALDAEGCLWVADALGGPMLRVAPGGQIAGQVDLPQGLHAYACALGGDDGRTLLLCCAPDALEHNREPVREAILFTMPVDVPGAEHAHP
jgi:alkylation response protein AidB-like acyl-CoA dehydrogenase